MGSVNSIEETLGGSDLEPTTAEPVTTEPVATESCLCFIPDDNSLKPVEITKSTAQGCGVERNPDVKIKAMKIHQTYLAKIFKGTKTIEARLTNEKWNLKEGETIKLFSETLEDDKGKYKEMLLVEHITTRRYEPGNEVDALTALLCTEDLTKVLPDVDNLADATEIYLQWITERQISEQGMLAIEIKPISQIIRIDSWRF
jgi:ASC-1-like (ASCH) protein